MLKKFFFRKKHYKDSTAKGLSSYYGCFRDKETDILLTSGCIDSKKTYCYIVATDKIGFQWKYYLWLFFGIIYLIGLFIVLSSQPKEAFFQNHTYSDIYILLIYVAIGLFTEKYFYFHDDLKKIKNGIKGGNLQEALERLETNQKNYKLSIAKVHHL